MSDEFWKLPHYDRKITRTSRERSQWLQFSRERSMNAVQSHRTTVHKTIAVPSRSDDSAAVSPRGRLKSVARSPTTPRVRTWVAVTPPWQTEALTRRLYTAFYVTQLRLYCAKYCDSTAFYLFYITLVQRIYGAVIVLTIKELRY